MWSKSPFCVRCGKLTAWPHGFELDHVKALDNGGEDTEENCQVLCVARDKEGVKTGCHVKKTAEDLGYKIKPQIGLDGYPIKD